MKNNIQESINDEYYYSDEYDKPAEPHRINHEERIHILQHENEQQARIISELQNDLNHEIENSRKIKESANKMAFAMESKEIFIGPQASDDVIYSRFQSLLGQIKTWSIPFARDLTTISEDLSLINLQEFQKVAPAVSDLPRFLQVPKNARLFVRGYVSLAMAESLFRTFPNEPHPGSDAEDVWMDKEVAHSVFLIENNLFYAGKRSFRALRLPLIYPFPKTAKPFHTANFTTGEH